MVHQVTTGQLFPDGVDCVEDVLASVLQLEGGFPVAPGDFELDHVCGVPQAEGVVAALLDIYRGTGTTPSMSAAADGVLPDGVHARVVRRLPKLIINDAVAHKIGAAVRAQLLDNGVAARLFNVRGACPVDTAGWLVGVQVIKAHDLAPSSVQGVLAAHAASGQEPMPHLLEDTLKFLHEATADLRWLRTFSKTIVERFRDRSAEYTSPEALLATLVLVQPLSKVHDGVPPPPRPGGGGGQGRGVAADPAIRALRRSTTTTTSTAAALSRRNHKKRPAVAGIPHEEAAPAARQKRRAAPPAKRMVDPMDVDPLPASELVEEAVPMEVDSVVVAVALPAVAPLKEPVPLYARPPLVTAPTKAPVEPLPAVPAAASPYFATVPSPHTVAMPATETGVVASPPLVAVPAHQVDQFHQMMANMDPATLANLRAFFAPQPQQPAVYHHPPLPALVGSPQSVTTAAVSFPTREPTAPRAPARGCAASARGDGVRRDSDTEDDEEGGAHQPPARAPTAPDASAAATPATPSAAAAPTASPAAARRAVLREVMRVSAPPPPPIGGV